MLKRTLFIVAAFLVAVFFLLTLLMCCQKSKQWSPPSTLKSSEIDTIESALRVKFPVSTKKIKAYFSEDMPDSWLWCLIDFSKADLERFMTDITWVPANEVRASKIELYMAPPVGLYFDCWKGGEHVQWWKPQKNYIKWISTRSKRGGYDLVILLEQPDDTTCRAYMRISDFTDNFPKEIFDVFPINSPNWDLRESEPYPIR